MKEKRETDLLDHIDFDMNIEENIITLSTK